MFQVKDTLDKSNSSTSRVVVALSGEPQNLSSSERYLQTLPKIKGSIDLREFEIIAQGGTHDVYRLKGETDPEFVIKVMRNYVGKEIATLEAHRDKLAGQYSPLYKVFEEHRCIVEQRVVTTVVTDDPSVPQTAILSIAPFNTCFKSKGRFSFQVSAVEADEVKLSKYPHEYYAMTLKLMGRDDEANEFSWENFLIFEENFRKIFAKLDGDEGKELRVVMKEFLEKYTEFYQQTGILLDCIGADNVLFYKDVQGWQFKLGSVIKHDTKEHTLKTIAAFSEDPTYIKDSFEKMTPIFFMPSCIRALNAIALKLGMKVRVVADITLTKPDITGLSKAYLQLYYSTRAKNYADHQQFDKALELYRLAYHQETVDNITQLSFELGTAYWKYLSENDAKPSSIDEIESYILMLSDKRSQFSLDQQPIADEAIRGLNEKLEDLIPNIPSPESHKKYKLH